MKQRAGENLIWFGTNKSGKKLREEILRLLLLKKGYFHFKAEENLPQKHPQGEETTEGR